MVVGICHFVQKLQIPMQIGISAEVLLLGVLLLEVLVHLHHPEV